MIAQIAGLPTKIRKCFPDATRISAVSETHVSVVMGDDGEAEEEDEDDDDQEPESHDAAAIIAAGSLIDIELESAQLCSELLEVDVVSVGDEMDLAEDRLRI